VALGDGIRRNVATISQEERNRLRDAIIALQQRFYPGNRNDVPLPGGVSFWFKQDEIHQATHVHNGPAFLPWHRELCNRFEALLREVDPQLSLHYWDWTTDPHGLFTSTFMGAANGSAGAPWLNAGLYNPTATPFRADNPFDPNNNPADPPRTLTRNLAAGPPPSGGPGWPSDQSILNALTFPQMRFLLEAAHNSSHGYIGGTIGDPHTSFRDPFVFLLHSNVDRLFARWQTDPAHPWRLDPNQVYGSEGSTTGLRGIMTPLDPWAGNPSNNPAIRRVRPWAPPENEQVVKNSKHPTVVVPPAYDTNLDTVKPVTTCAFFPVPTNAQGWNNSDVTVTLHATDNPGGSGVASITYSLNGVQQPPEQKDTVSFVIATEGQTTITFHAADKAGNTETPDKTCTVKLDKTPPTITVAVPANGATFVLDEQVNAAYSCGDAGGSGLKSCAGSVPSGSPIDTSTFGTKTFTVEAEDNAGNKISKLLTYNVFFNFSGFFPPVDNWPKLNKRNAGANVPVKFSLGGDQGLDVLVPGYPKSQEIPCNNPNVEVAGTDPTISTGSGLTYDPGSDQYQYNWKTERMWEGTCRQLVVKLKDGSFHRANFEFT